MLVRLTRNEVPVSYTCCGFSSTDWVASPKSHNQAKASEELFVKTTLLEKGSVSPPGLLEIWYSKPETELLPLSVSSSLLQEESTITSRAGRRNILFIFL
jgi:hypothetical protein